MKVGAMPEVREKKRVLIVGDADSFSRTTIDALRNMYDVIVLENVTSFTQQADLILVDIDTHIGKNVVEKVDTTKRIPIIALSVSDDTILGEWTKKMNIRHQLNKIWTSPSALLRVIAGVLN